LDAQEELKQHLKDLREIFDKVITPLAKCTLSAIDRGLDPESARTAVRPVVDVIVQILLLADTRDHESPAKGEALDKDLSDKLRTLSEQTAKYLNGQERDKCLEFGSSPLPPYAKHRQSPQLYTAIAYLVLFSNADELALKIMRDAEGRGVEPDLTFLRLQYRILWFQNESAFRYLPYLEKARRAARANRQLVDIALSRCKVLRCTEFSTIEEHSYRFRHEELRAMNNIAYGIAQDMAGRVSSAEPLQGIAEDYVEEILKVIDSGDMEKIAPKGSENIKYSYLDTVAFVWLVVQARKSNPNLEVVRKAEAMFAKAVGQGEIALAEEISRQDERTQTQYSQARARQQLRSYRQLRVTLRTRRSHLNSARALLEQ
jgi:hypothetical protein